MQIFDLVIQIFMAVSMIFGVVMVVFTIGYRHFLRTNERICRYIIGILLVYSVFTRYLIHLPGEFPFMKEVSIGFDVLYIAIMIFFNINLFMRKETHDRGRRKSDG